MSKHEATARTRTLGYSALLLCACGLLGGCTWDQLNPFKPPPPPPPPLQSFVLRDGNLVPEAAPKEKSAEADLAGAHELYRREEYAKAEKVFHRIGNYDKNPMSVIQEALFYEGECLRLQGYLPKAADVYAEMLKKQSISPYRDLAIQHIYEISTYWLQETWEELRESQERREGKRWVVWPRFINFDKRKPFLDREGRALERLRDVSMFEGKGGPYADKALYLCGYVSWYKEDYRDAEQEFSNLTQYHSESPLAAEAISLAIRAKLMSTGGEMYDGQKVHEARKLVDQALRMPDMTMEKKKELTDLLTSITKFQAEKEYQMAEFWRRTGHPGSAYFYYEIVRRRYPDNNPGSAADRSFKRMMEIREKMAKEQRDKLGPPPEDEGRPAEQLLPPRRVVNQPETIPMPRPAQEGTQLPQPRPLPPGVGGNGQP
jgi:outer membrane protein assembly factor BamD (BamD/ComL family)